MKSFTGFTIDNDLLEKIDGLKIQRNTNRSEALRHIVSEYFKSDSKDLIDEIEKLKLLNFELKYQLEAMTKTLKNHDSHVVSMLLLIGGKDPKFREEVKKRFPQFWNKNPK